MNNSVQLRLQIMMFLQFFVWGAWFATLSQCLSANELSAFEGGSYGTAPIAAIIAPLFLGLVADRFFPSQIVMGLLFLLCGVFMYLAFGYAKAGDGDMMVWMFLAHMLCYMPTLGLGNTIAFTNIADQNEFPKIRVWGTIGWIVAGLVVGFMTWSRDLQILWLAAIVSFVLGVFSFVLPNTPPPAKGTPLSWRSLLMVDAFKLLANVPFAIFMLCSTLICIPLAYYYGLVSKVLSQVGFLEPASTMTLGQMSEIFFMILIPFFFRRLGVKWMILIGMAAWVVRYLLFAFGAPDQVAWMFFLGVLLHGICYDFFFVTGFMYTDQKAPPEVRGQAQSMLVFFTQGVGMYFGYKVAFGRNATTVTKYGELQDAIDAARPEEIPTYAEQLGRMFSVSMPDGIDPTLLAETMAQWKEFWLVPAGMAVGVLVLFALAFHDKSAAAEAPKDVDE